jgi:hypothetical protein
VSYRFVDSFPAGPRWNCSGILNYSLSSTKALKIVKPCFFCGGSGQLLADFCFSRGVLGAKPSRELGISAVYFLLLLAIMN